MSLFDLFKPKAPEVIIKPDQVELPFPAGLVKGQKEVDPRDYQFSELKACKATKEEELPKVFSIKDKFPPVYTQVWGSCTANAAIGCDNYYYPNPKSPSTTFTYHQARVIDGCGSDRTDDGSTVESALKAVRKWGVCSTKYWPNDKPFYKKPSKKAYQNGLAGKEITTFHVTKSLLQIKKALYSGYPVAIAIAWAFHSIDGNTWILNDPTPEEIENVKSGHAMVIVGWDDNKKLWEVRNSWGPEWANNGYAYITYETMKRAIWLDDCYAVVK